MNLTQRQTAALATAERSSKAQAIIAVALPITVCCKREKPPCFLARRMRNTLMPSLGKYHHYHRRYVPSTPFATSIWQFDISLRRNGDDKDSLRELSALSLCACKQLERQMQMQVL